MATFVHGIAASENIDSSGERLLMSGLDISTLAIDGVFNWEHKKDFPGQTVGKILKAKKIFSEQDCEDDQQLYFWNKITTPYLYVMGELFDDFQESAQDCAGMFKYDAAKKGKQDTNVVSFSIEGAKIEKQGMDVTRSVARKVTITNLPCNKAADAEMLTDGESENGDDVDSIFKAEVIEISLIKNADKLGIVSMKKTLTTKPGIPTASPAAPMGGDKGLPSKTTNAGQKMGTTSSGKDVFTHAKIHNYNNFSATDHKEAAEMHFKAASSASDHSNASRHRQTMNLHNQALKTAESKEGRFARGKAIATNIEDKKFKQSIAKADTLGSSNAAPGQLTGHAALQKQNVDKKLKKTCAKHMKKGLADQKGVHTPFDHVAGKQMSAKTNDKKGAGMSHQIHDTSMGAKAAHKQVLGEIKAMPKPNLGKSEESPIGTTRSGKSIMPKADHPSHANFTKADHNDAANMHDHISTQMDKTHANGVIGGSEMHSDPAIVAKYKDHYTQEKAHQSLGSKVRPSKMPSTMKQAKAGQSSAAKKNAETASRMAKSEWLERAEQAYSSWGKKEEFRQFMQIKMPHLALGEIDAIGQTIALKKSLEAEESLAKMAGLKKSKK